MRISANLVESILISAQNEVAAERRENRDKDVDFGAVVAAFRRAEELRQENFIYKKVRGRKSGVKQTVITTTRHKCEGAPLVDYTLCLIPYAGRRPFKYDIMKTNELGKVKDSTVIVKACIPMFREQWIRDDRLESA
jgi:hypothetical protein